MPRDEVGLRAGMRRWRAITWSFAALQPKFFLAYPNWVISSYITRFIGLAVSTFFWGGIYANTTEVNGISYQQMINYIILASLFGSAALEGVAFDVGWMIKRGEIATEFTRPVDLQYRFLVGQLSSLVVGLVISAPLAVAAVVLFQVQMPSDPLVWLCFAVSMVLGTSVMFCFDWILMALVFYTMEPWGIGVLREGVAAFFSGLLIPLTVMPDWLRGIASALPFAQAIFVPVSILSGQVPVSDAPRLWLTQLVWLAVLLVLSRWLFNIAARKVTIQGG